MEVVSVRLIKGFVGPGGTQGAGVAFSPSSAVSASSTLAPSAVAKSVDSVVCDFEVSEEIAMLSTSGTLHRCSSVEGLLWVVPPLRLQSLDRLLCCDCSMSNHHQTLSQLRRPHVPSDLPVHDRAPVLGSPG